MGEVEGVGWDGGGRGRGGGGRWGRWGLARLAKLTISGDLTRIASLLSFRFRVRFRFCRRMAFPSIHTIRYDTIPGDFFPFHLLHLRRPSLQTACATPPPLLQLLLLLLLCTDYLLLYLFCILLLVSYNITVLHVLRPLSSSIKELFLSGHHTTTSYE